MSTQNRNLATTFAKGLAVLRALAASRTPQSLADLARATGFDRATTRRLVLTLVDQGYARQDPRGVALCAHVLRLGAGYLQAQSFGTQVQPALDRHGEALGHAISLAVRDAGAALLVAQSTRTGTPVSFGFTLGSTLPLLHTALGRMLLAQAADPEALIAALPAMRHTARTEMDPARIAQAVRAARAQGFCRAEGEFEPGILGLSVPAGPAAALGVSLPLGAGAQDATDGVLRALQLCAADIARTDFGRAGAGAGGG